MGSDGGGQQALRPAGDGVPVPVEWVGMEVAQHGCLRKQWPADLLTLGAAACKFVWVLL